MMNLSTEERLFLDVALETVSAMYAMAINKLTDEKGLSEYEKAELEKDIDMYEYEKMIINGLEPVSPEIRRSIIDKVKNQYGLFLKKHYGAA